MSTSCSCCKRSSSDRVRVFLSYGEGELEFWPVTACTTWREVERMAFYHVNEVNPKATLFQLRTQRPDGSGNLARYRRDAAGCWRRIYSDGVMPYWLPLAFFGVVVVGMFIVTCGVFWLLGP